jgi:hypothetical protein
MSFYYSPDDESVFEKAIPEINKDLRTAELRLPPTSDEREKVKKVFLEFVRERGRVIYGGYAFHLLVKKGSKNQEVVYQEDDHPDIEFYTPNLKADVRDLCNLLRDKGYQHILAEEGVHPSTFKLRVEFVDVGDITFLPLPFYEVIPYEKIEGVKVIDAEYAMLDVFRVYAFPITRFFRLQKTFTRASLLLKYYPMSWNEPAPPPGTGHAHADTVLTQFISTGVFSSDMIVTGQVAQNVFCREAGVEVDRLSLPIISLSASYEKDVARLTRLFRGSPKTFLPFSEYIGRKTLFFDKGNAVLALIEIEDDCLAYVKDKVSNCNITTLHGTAYYALSMIYQAYTQKRQKEVKQNRRILQRLLEAKKAYHTKHPEATIVTKGLFREFDVQCQGNALTTFRKFGMDKQKRRDNREVIKYYYYPNEPETSRANRAFFAMNTFQTVGQDESTLATQETKRRKNTEDE